MTNQVKEDLESIRKKIIEHIEMDILQDKYEGEQGKNIVSQIKTMNEEQLIAFLKQQGLLKEDGTPQKESQCIFCSMIAGQMPITKIAENEEAIAILELNPISQGHSLIIPKKHLESEDQLSSEIKDLAEEVSQQLQKAFTAQRIDKISSNIMGHQIINLLPIFSNETMESPRTKQTPEGLAKLKESFNKSKPEQIEQKQEIEEEPDEENKIEQISEKEMILPKRIP